jgi:hypothetical protein
MAISTLTDLYIRSTSGHLQRKQSLDVTKQLHEKATKELRHKAGVEGISQRMEQVKTDQRPTFVTVNLQLRAWRPR